MSFSVRPAHPHNTEIHCKFCRWMPQPSPDPGVLDFWMLENLYNWEGFNNLSPLSVTQAFVWSSVLLSQTSRVRSTRILFLWCQLYGACMVWNLSAVSCEHLSQGTAPSKYSMRQWGASCAFLQPGYTLKMRLLWRYLSPLCCFSSTNGSFLLPSSTSTPCHCPPILHCHLDPPSRR